MGFYSCKMSSSIGLALNVDGQQNINKFWFMLIFSTKNAWSFDFFTFNGKNPILGIGQHEIFSDGSEFRYDSEQFFGHLNGPKYRHF